jgi:hypothetical protein
MKRFIFLTLSTGIFIILLTCCNSKVQTNSKPEKESSQIVFPKSIEMERVVATPPQEINLSSVADSIEYIPLETCKKALIKDIFQTVPMDSFIFVFTSRNVFKFSQKGKYISQIGENGRGPGEYPGIRNISVDNKNKQVFIYPNFIRKLLKYTSHNEFIGDVPLFNSDLASDISFIGNNHFIATGVFTIPGEMTKNMFLVAVIDSTGKVKKIVDTPIHQFPNYLDRKDIFYPGTYLPSYFDTIVLSMGFGCDTIYAVNQQSIKPRYILNFGKYNAPAEVKYGFSRDTGVRIKISEKRYKYLWIEKSPIETREFLFLYFSLEDHMYLAAYNKLTDSVSVFRKKGEVKYGSIRNVEDFGFKNDLDGGLPFYPKWTNFKSKDWITSYDAIELKSKLKEIQQNPSANPEKHQSLIELINKLRENDNPVVVIAHLK